MSVKVSTFYLTSYKKYLKRSYAFKMKKTNRGFRNSEIQSNYHHKVMTSHPHFARSIAGGFYESLPRGRVRFKSVVNIILRKKRH